MQRNAEKAQYSLNSSENTESLYCIIYRFGEYYTDNAELGKLHIKHTIWGTLCKIFDHQIYGYLYYLHSYFDIYSYLHIDYHLRRYNIEYFCAEEFDQPVNVMLTFFYFIQNAHSTCSDVQTKHSTALLSS